MERPGPAAPDSLPAAEATVRIDETHAWIFDLDGVLTDTARLHLRAWQATFDRWLGAIAGEGTDRAPFTADEYMRLVDGRSPVAAVRAVLEQRGASIAEGSPADSPDASTLWGIVNDKDARYLQLVSGGGLRAFPGSVHLLKRLRARGIAIAVVSGSRHCADILRLVGIADMVDVRVDGRTALAMGLPGKPDPALFLEAACRLGVNPRQAVVVEDAEAGVEAGRRGGFRVVVGVDRTGHGEELRRHGAHLVVEDLGGFRLVGKGPGEDPWCLSYRNPEPADEGLVETLCTLANGYLGTRGARPWAHDDGVAYPGTYIAGLYDRLSTDVEGRTIAVESLVNLPNWLPLTFRPADEMWLGTEHAEVVTHWIRLDLRHGELVRRCVVTHSGGQRTAMIERRFVSMADPHLVGQELHLVPLDWSGQLEVRSGVDANVRADETTEERLLENRHFDLVAEGVHNGTDPWVEVRTVESHVTVAVASRCRLTVPSGGEGRPGTPALAGSPGAVMTTRVDPDQRVTLEKVAALYTSRDRAIDEPRSASLLACDSAGSFGEVLKDHRVAWDQLWRRSELAISDGESSTKTLNLHFFHLLQVASPQIVDLDTGLGARGLHGEGYSGHVFWDSLFAFPVLNLRLPEVSRALLGYRWRRLPAARRAAESAGFSGALFPWQSGSDGRDQTPFTLFNPRSGRWIPDRTRFERHVGLAIAYCAWQYWQVTGDFDFLAGVGADLIFEVARCFASMTCSIEGSDRLHITQVMGPDEFHDRYPWSEEPGVSDNAYTNVMTSWVLWRATEAFEMLRNADRMDVAERLGLGQSEIDRWDSVSRGLAIPFHEGVISQFDGYERLDPIDLDKYRAQYGNIGRLDLILDAEGDSVCRYQVGKQADVLMLFYLLSAEELRKVFERQGYRLEPDMIRRTIEYYAARVTHGSSLSTTVHAWVLARANRFASWRYFQDALSLDIADAQGGTTREGVHLGAMAGTIDLVQRCYPGLEVRDGALWLHPLLPAQLRGIHVEVLFRGLALEIDIDHHRLVVNARSGRGTPATLMISGDPHTVSSGQSVMVTLPHRR